jgi:molybdenum cofactor guanylyltransferase
MKNFINSATCTGIVLAGGKSLRMGMDKGLLQWKGKPLVEYPVEALKKFCNTIIISTNNDEYAYLGLPIVKDIHTVIGPMGGLHAGLNTSISENNIVLSCDMPLIDEEIVRLLLAGSENCQAVVPVVENRLIPVCSYYHSSALPILEKEIRAGLHKTVLFLQRLRFKELLITNPGLQNKFFNINTVEDFNHLESL